MTKGGTFREGLYFRINVLLIKVPPLRERPDDILVLVLDRRVLPPQLRNGGGVPASDEPQVPIV